MLNTEFSPWPSYTKEEAEAVSKVLLSNKVNYWTGTECRSFEKEFSEYVGVKYSVALANGTLALDLALRILKLNKEDEVIVTSRTFLASASSIVMAGAKPVFVDVDIDTQVITKETIISKITEKTKAIIVVHLAGMPAEMDEIMSLAKIHNLFVIEDCAQAHGAKYKGKSVGSIGHIGAWSFCQDKIISTGGEGGMVTTNSDVLWEKLWSAKDHGKSYQTVYKKNQNEGYRWLHESFGTNCRMTEMQAAIGRIQLRNLPAWSKIRRENAAILEKSVSDLKIIRKFSTPNYIEHAKYKHYMLINNDFLAKDWTRDRIINEIKSKGVPAYQGSCSEVYKEKAFDNTGYRPTTPLKNAIELGKISLMFLVHPTLTEKEIRKTALVIREVLLAASV